MTTVRSNEPRAIVEAVAGSAVELRLLEPPPAIFERLHHAGSSLMLIQRGRAGERVLAVADDVSHGFTPGCELNSDEDHTPIQLSTTQLELLANALALRPPAPVRVIESGIKVIDVASPLVDGGSTWLIGGPHVGRIKFLEELHRRLVARGHRQTLVFPIVPRDAATIAPTVAAAGFPDDREAGVRCVWLVSQHAIEPALAERAALGTTRVVFTPRIAQRERWPAIDAAASRSIVAPDPLVAELVATLERAARLREQPDHPDPDGARTLALAETLERYFAQPFDSGIAFTGRPGTWVPSDRARADCRLILDGAEPEAGFDFEA